MMSGSGGAVSLLPFGPAFAGFLVASLAVNFTPGPDMLYVIGRSVGQGRQAGIVAALGIFAGCLLHIAAAAVGLAALLELVPTAYLVLKYAGVAYLLYIGARMILTAGAAGDDAAASKAPSAPLWAIFRQGAITNALNPKVALFFLAFLPQFVDHGTAANASAAAATPALQMLALGLVFDVGGLLVNGGVACGFGTAGDWLRRRPGVWRWQQRVTGGIFVALALRLALPERR
jgi:threonine/homoserine/homoserine lactone efflux protein